MFTFRKSVLCISVLSVCLFPSIAVEAKNSFCNIKGDNVNVRSAPSVSSSLVGKLSGGKATIKDHSGDWYKISSGNTNGWVRKDFITLTTSPSKIAETKTSNQTQPSSVISVDAVLKGDNVNVRSKPTTTANVKSKLSGVSVKIIGTSGEWFKISYNGSEGWVKDDFVVIPKNSASALRKVSPTASRGQITSTSQSIKNGTITGENVNLRAKPTKTADVVAKFSNKKVNILSQSGDWYKVSSGETTGWILKDFVSTSSTSSSSSSKTPVSKTPVTSSRTESLRKNMVLYSRGFLGVQYRYGGESPRGFDCSGFTNYVYKKYGIDINRTAADQAKQGTYVPKTKLKPGDLVFFDTNGGKNKQINHAGMYIGNGKFIHASSSRTGAQVRISSLNESFYAKAYVTGKSFVK